MRHANKLSKRIALGLLALAVAFFCVPAGGGAERVVEVRPEVHIPAYTSEVDRVVAAYERLMDRLLDQRDQGQLQMISVARENQDISKRVELMDHKLDLVLVKLARIEKAMGILPEEPMPPAPPRVEPPRMPDESLP